MEYGLDIGPATIRVATDAGDGPTIDSVPADVLPVDDATIEATGLSREDGVVDVDGTTYAVSTAARVAADAVDEEPQSLFATDTPTVETDAAARAILTALVDDAIGAATDGRLCYATADAFVDTALPTDTPRETVASVLADRGFDVTPLSKGFAVVYDQLAADKYTGLGVCIEARTTSVSMAYYGVPAMAVSIAKGREWIVERVTDETTYTRSQVVDALETMTLDPDAATDELESALAEAYDALVADMIEAVQAAADESDVRRGVSVPVAIAGDGTIEGLEYLVGGRLDAAGVPFSIRDVRLADAPAESAVRGALAAARDGVDADETIAGADSGIDPVSPDTPATDPTAGSEHPAGTELAFDEFAVDDVATDRTDDAIDQLFARLATRDDEIQSVREELDSLLEELADVQTRAAAAEDVAELEDELATLSDTLAAVRDDVETISDRTATVDEAVGELRADLEGLETTVATEAALAALERTVDELAAAVADLERDAEQRATRLDDVAEGIDGLQTRLHGVSGRLEEEAERTAIRLETLETTIDEEIAAVDDDLATVRETVDDRAESLESRLEAVRDAVDDLETTAATDERVDRVENDLADLETAVDDVDGTVSTISAHLDDLDERTVSTKTVDEMRVALERIDDDVGDLESSLASLEDRIDEAVDDLTAHLESATSTINDDLATLETTVKRLEAESVRDDELSPLRDSLADANDDIESVGAAVDDLETSLEDDITDVERETDSLADTVSAIDERTAETDRRLADHDDRIDALASTMDTVDDDADLARDLESLRTDHEQLAQTVESDPDEETIRSIESDLEAVDDRLTELGEHHASLEDDLDDVRTDARATPGLASSTAAGGGAAGVVAGAVAAIAGNSAIGAGAAILGLVLIGVATVLARGRDVADA